MAGEKGVLAAGGPEQSPTDAAEGEGAGGGRVRGGGVVERALREAHFAVHLAKVLFIVDLRSKPTKNCNK